MKLSLRLCLLSAVALAGSASAALVAHYSFDDAEALGANSGSATTSWTQFTGVTQTPGRFGAGAGQFTAPTSQAYNGSFNVGADLSNFTLSMHVKTTQTNQWKDYVSIGIGTSTFVLEQNGAAGVSVFNINSPGGNNGGQTTYNGFKVNDGAWHQLGVTVSNNVLTLYVDGESRGTAAYTGSGAINSFQLASRFGDGNRALTTQIDDVAVYDTALNATQMNWLASNAATTMPIPEPAASLLGTLGVLALLRRRRS